MRAAARSSAEARRFATSAAQTDTKRSSANESSFSRYAGMAFFGAVVRVLNLEKGGPATRILELKRLLFVMAIVV